MYIYIYFYYNLTLLCTRYHYITILRDPVKRFLSEWKHVQRGATWKTSPLMCDGHSAAGKEVPYCFKGEDWEGVSLDEFLDCESNLARNRQTRMLADLTLVNCYNTTGQDQDTRDQVMLESAKQNLLNMDYFGLTEFQIRTQKLFEYTFNLKFINDFEQLPVTRSDRTNITNKQKEKILEQNRLDIVLYQYAKDLFLQRSKRMMQELGKDLFDSLYENENTKDSFDDSLDIAEDDKDDVS